MAAASPHPRPAAAIRRRHDTPAHGVYAQLIDPAIFALLPTAPRENDRLATFRAVLR